ncbi:MAG: TusE/DsrC/DsvC family sulfur relay protein [Candidatus Latescibacteria bacterium]|nr:TusE/DsrC/DsvC family sulfur relay protein [Candidatus Latescibacterota bacterium]NIO56732.1 TusE/DsrC/DsvC family sulfur relay protein [Candidatus Latescibacterota bacterium]NIT02317.1 TusE/DsrC/DsvC family sulfur relay protein [Candidatus Latescibacterota bacterium]NIT39200.1 TusE/DsrC/DsvC family sulfur relay protein [Candidatus Latescibacterota bacterium]
MEPKSIEFGGKDYTLDEHGFLDPPEQWDETFAEGMARMQGIFDGLTGEHWSFIHYLRRKFLEEHTVPVVVLACADNNIRLNKLKQLFPTGYHRGACRIAGINYEFMYESNIWLTYESHGVLSPEQKLTQAGFLEDFEQWDERFAHLVAREWNLTHGLTDRHWEVINYLRDFYRVHKNIPTVYETCQANHLTLDELRSLFPAGYRRGACRAAGLPFFG